VGEFPVWEQNVVLVALSFRDYSHWLLKTAKEADYQRPAEMYLSCTR
jgi:hypothetical protein